MFDEAVAGIKKVAEAWSLSLPEKAVADIAAYFVELLRWNERINLTGARGVRDLVGEHLDDSFALSRMVPAGSSVVDVGSGGGLPAVPLAMIRPDVSVCMVEPRAKRVAFLRSLQRSCPSLEVRHGRWEDLGARKFAVAISRATFPPKEWLEIGARLVVPAGFVVVLASGPVSEMEVSGRLVESVEYTSGTGMPRWVGKYCFT